jgi:hypothetical protein
MVSFSHDISVLHHPRFLTCLFAQTFLTNRIRNTSIGQPFAIGQRADILLGDLDVGSGKLVKVHQFDPSVFVRKYI